MAATPRTYRRVARVPAVAFLALLVFPVTALLIPAAGGTRLLVALLATLAAFAVIAGHVSRRIREGKAQLTTQFIVVDCETSAKRAVKTYRYFDDAHTPTKQASARLAPYYRDIIRKLSNQCSGIADPQGRAAALEEVRELAAEWAPEALAFRMEMEYWHDRGDTALQDIHLTLGDALTSDRTGSEQVSDQTR